MYDGADGHENENDHEADHEDIEGDSGHRERDDCNSQGGAAYGDVGAEADGDYENTRDDDSDDAHFDCCKRDEDVGDGDNHKQGEDHDDGEDDDHHCQ